MSLFVDYVIPFLILLTVVVFVHEMGHYSVARRNGVKVEVFSVGFGREIIGWTDRQGTRWKLGMIPFGGYVRMFGDEDETSKADTSREFSDEEKKISFHHKRLGQRAAIVAAGPLSNLIFAVLVFAVLYATAGQPTTPPVIGVVQPGSAAEAAGIKPGDRIVAIDGREIQRFEQIQQAVRLGNGAEIVLTLEAGNQRRETKAKPVMSEFKDHFGNAQKLPLLGIGASGEYTDFVRLGPIDATIEAVRQCWVVTEGTFAAVGQMIMGRRDSSELGGPLRIAQYSGQAAQGGAASFIVFIAILSINLALINLFPIPMLDGGHLLFYLFEGVLGRPLSDQTQEYGFRFGLILVFALLVFSTWNDLIHLKVWDFLKG
jgi:regulator of sigma E protease